jgi:hypothetical protein
MSVRECIVRAGSKPASVEVLARQTIRIPREGWTSGSMVNMEESEAEAIVTRFSRGKQGDLG